MTPSYISSQNTIFFFWNSDLLPKTFLILYPSFGNSTTEITLLLTLFVPLGLVETVFAYLEELPDWDMQSLLEYVHIDFCFSRVNLDLILYQLSKALTLICFMSGRL